MKALLVLLLFLSTAALARPTNTSHLRKTIIDNETTLSIQIEGTQQGRPIRYQRSFDVAGMGTLQKEWLMARVFIEQGIPLSLHETPWLSISTLGLIGLLLSFLIVRHQHHNRRLTPVRISTAHTR